MRKPVETGNRVARAVVVERVQTGVRLEKRILKVSRALADLLDLSLGDLLEGVLLHAFEGKAAFGPKTLRKIEELKKVYGLDVGAEASHRMRDATRLAAPHRASDEPK